MVAERKQMLTAGSAQKITIYMNEDTPSTDRYLCDQVLQFLFDQEVAGAILTRSQGGFGSRHTVHDRTSATFSAAHLPVRIEVIDSEEKVAAIVPKLCELVTDGLIEMHETTVVKTVPLQKEGSR